MAINTANLRGNSLSSGRINPIGLLPKPYQPPVYGPQLPQGFNPQKPTPTPSYNPPKAPTASTGGDIYSAITKALEMQRQASQPAIASLQSGANELKGFYKEQTKKLESQISPLKERYDSLIGQIKGNQTTAENRQTVTTANELGRRGILPSSGLGEQTITSAVNPITQQYTGDIAEAGYQREAGIQGILEQIASLSGQRTGALSDINTSIAGLQGGDINSAIQNAISIMGAQSSGGSDALRNQPFQWLLGRGGQSTAPNYSPNTGEGTVSKDGVWVYRGGRWVQNNASTGNLSELDDLYLFSQS